MLAGWPSILYSYIRIPCVEASTLTHTITALAICPKPILQDLAPPHLALHHCEGIKVGHEDFLVFPNLLESYHFLARRIETRLLSGIGVGRAAMVEPAVEG
jgi:hypothetical protein